MVERLSGHNQPSVSLASCDPGIEPGGRWGESANRRSAPPSHHHLLPSRAGVARCSSFSSTSQRSAAPLASGW